MGVDLRGTAYEDDVIATGYGSHLALPIMRAKWTPDLDEGEARALLEDCLRVLFYRDCRALDTVVLSKAGPPARSSRTPTSSRPTGRRRPSSRPRPAATAMAAGDGKTLAGGRTCPQLDYIPTSKRWDD